MRVSRFCQMILSLACMLLPISAFADEVKGIVADQAGLPVTGAFVLQKGTSNGTVTDLDGQFSINVPISVRRKNLRHCLTI